MGRQGWLKGAVAVGVGACIGVGSPLQAADPTQPVVELVIPGSTVPAVPCTSGGGCKYDPTTWYSHRVDGVAAEDGVGRTAVLLELDGNPGIELVVGAPGADNGKGKVYVIYNYPSRAGRPINLESEVAFTSLKAWNLGFSLAVGDVTGDGRADLAIGAPGGSSYSYVYIVTGGKVYAGGDLSSVSGIITLNDSNLKGTDFGFSLAAGNLTGDGAAELVVGAPLAAKAALFTGPIKSGATASYVLGGTSGDLTGWSVAILGDMSANGYPEFGVGCPQANSGGGKVILIDGSITGGTTPGVELKHARVSPQAPLTMITINGDISNGSTPFGNLGRSLASLGDLTGDGYPELLLGAPGEPPCASGPCLESGGRVYLLHGTPEYFGKYSSYNLSAIAAGYLEGEAGGDGLGLSMAGVGDVDGSGLPDLLVGAPYSSGMAKQAGAAYLVEGEALINLRGAYPVYKLALLTFLGSSEGAYLGGSLRGWTAGIMDSGYRGDFAIGSLGYQTAQGAGAGRLHLFSGEDFFDLDSDAQARSQGDCNDQRETVYYDSAGLIEVCNGIDDDCDSLADDADTYLANPAYTWYRDADGDGWGGSETRGTCTTTAPGSGWVSRSGDCNDSNGNVNPSATEACDTVDNDCDGLVDDADTGVTGQSTWYYDGDVDGFGTTSTTRAACNQPKGYVAAGGDCNDLNYDQNPAATESCNGIDDDCDGKVDDQDSPVSGMSTYFIDEDADGFGDPIQSSVACKAPAGMVLDATDCDDGHSTVNPEAPEICDGLDNDCDDLIDTKDPSVTASLYSLDEDGDGYGNPYTDPAPGCSAAPPEGYADNALDCDDSQMLVNPKATEVCNGLDDDCDEQLDEADSSLQGDYLYFQDADGDGEGSAITLATCSSSIPDGYTNNDRDCDDDDFEVNTSATEICDNKDNDCDGLTDDDDDSVEGGNLFYIDDDGDGFGDGDSPLVLCSSEAPAGYVYNASDCNDRDMTIYPEAEELCDGTDSNCGDPAGDAEDLDESDEDRDRYLTCEGDCNDQDSGVHPDEEEVCDEVDNDCDELTDEGVAPTWYEDEDEDGYGDHTETLESCTQPKDMVSNDLDCDDADESINPDAAEVCDGEDNDCNGEVDESDGGQWYEDSDQDGFGNPQAAHEGCDIGSNYVTDNTDCDDSQSSVYPGAEEVPGDGVDSDCNGEDGSSTPPPAPADPLYDAALSCACSTGVQDPPRSGGALLVWGLLATAVLRRRREALHPK